MDADYAESKRSKQSRRVRPAVGATISRCQACGGDDGLIGLGEIGGRVGGSRCIRQAGGRVEPENEPSAQPKGRDSRVARGIASTSKG